MKADLPALNSPTIDQQEERGQLLGRVARPRPGPRRCRGTRRAARRAAPAAPAPRPAARAALGQDRAGGRSSPRAAPRPVRGIGRRLVPSWLSLLLLGHARPSAGRRGAQHGGNGGAVQATNAVSSIKTEHRRRPRPLGRRARCRLPTRPDSLLAERNDVATPCDTSGSCPQRFDKPTGRVVASAAAEGFTTDQSAKRQARTLSGGADRTKGAPWRPLVLSACLELTGGDRSFD